MRFANADQGDYPPEKYRVDPHNFTGRDMGRFISLIRRNVSETEIDLFLRKNLSLLAFSSGFFSTGHHKTWIIPQAELKPGGFANGRGKKPDYLFAGENSDGITWWVIDLKSPQNKLYKKDKAGRIVETSQLSSGISQVRDYIHYCDENQSFIRGTLGLSSFTTPYGVVIIGREAELGADKGKKDYKKQFNQDSKAIKVKTFDAFIREIEFLSHISYKLNFLDKIYTSFFVRDEITPWDCWGVD